MGEKYSKLVRDFIPDMLDKKGITYSKEILSQSEYKTELIRKLNEEVKEFLGDESVDELADVLEVIDALKSIPEYQDVIDYQMKKRSEKGAFLKRIKLTGEKK